MSNYLLGAISCLCLLHAGVCGEECSKTIIAERRTLFIPKGNSLHLSCDVQHCGQNWTGNWGNLTNGKSLAVEESARHRLTRVVVSAITTRLELDFLRVDQSDNGAYACNVQWDQVTSQGHVTSVNITAAVASERPVLHRVLVCGSAFLCLPIIIGLACCLGSKVKPQPLPTVQSTHAAVYRDHPEPHPQPPPRCPVPQQRSISFSRVPQQPQQRTEVVYADISQGMLRQQGAAREPAPSTVYSSLVFS